MRWAEGRTFGLVFDGGPEVRQVAEEAARLFLHENALNTAAFPSLGEIQMRRVVDFAAMFVDLDPLIAKAGKKTRQTLYKIQERANIMIRELEPRSRI